MTDRATTTPSAGELAALVEHASRRVRSRLRTAVFVTEMALVLGLIGLWFAPYGHAHLNGLLVLLLYCFPSEFLIAPVPHEPLLIYFGKLYAPWLVASVSVVGTLIVEALNYHAFGFISDARPLRRVVHSPFIGRLVALFRRSPFTALLVGGLAPVPFYPLRFVVVLARYPLRRYLAAVLLSRLPRFYLLALLGSAMRLPDGLMAAIFLPFVLLGIAPLVPWKGLRQRWLNGPAQTQQPLPTARTVGSAESPALPTLANETP